MLTKQVNVFLNRCQGVIARGFWKDLQARIENKRNAPGKREDDIKLVLEKPEVYVEAYRQMLLDCAEKFFIRVVHPNFVRAVNGL